MNKADLVEKVARDANITKKAATRAVDSMIDGISYSLQKGKRVTLVGFGSFEVRRRAPRRASIGNSYRSVSNRHSRGSARTSRSAIWRCSTNGSWRTNP